MTASTAGRGRLVGLCLTSYVVGAVPFCNLTARRLRGVDLRTVGTGTVSGTGLWRVAGFWPLVVAGLSDVAKGAVGPLLARRWRDRPAAAVPAAAGAAVIGHNWSPFLGWSGGRGVAPAIGGLAVTAPAGSLLLLAGLGVGRLAGETALGCLAADCSLVPVLAARSGHGGTAVGAAVVVPMLVKRLLGNAPPADRRLGTYLTRLLLDRDTRSVQPWSVEPRSGVLR